MHRARSGKASLAFNSGGPEPAAASSATPAALDGTFTAAPLDTTSPAAQASLPDSDLIVDFLRDLPETRSIFAQAFSEPDTRALISSLHVGAQLAGDARETVMAERFANMARLYEQIAGEADGQTSGSSGKPEDNPAPALSSLSPAEHQQFAAVHLTDAARNALREAYALTLPTDGAPALQAGRFDPRAAQAMARILESPASTAGGNLVTVGQYPMSQQFLEDASNGFSFYIDDASQKQATADLAASPMRPSVARGDGRRFASGTPAHRLERS